MTRSYMWVKCQPSHAYNWWADCWKDRCFIMLYLKHNMFILRDTEVVNMYDICFMKEAIGRYNRGTMVNFYFLINNKYLAHSDLEYSNSINLWVSGQSAIPWSHKSQLHRMNHLLLQLFLASCTVWTTRTSFQKEIEINSTQLRCTFST